MCGPGTSWDGATAADGCSCDECRCADGGGWWCWSAPPVWRASPPRSRAKTRFGALLSRARAVAGDASALVFAVVAVSAVMAITASPYRRRDR